MRTTETFMMQGVMRKWILLSPNKWGSPAKLTRAKISHFVAFVNKDNAKDVYCLTLTKLWNQKWSTEKNSIWIIFLQSNFHRNSISKWYQKQTLVLSRMVSHYWIVSKPLSSLRPSARKMLGIAQSAKILCQLKSR